MDRCGEGEVGLAAIGPDQVVREEIVQGVGRAALREIVAVREEAELDGADFPRHQPLLAGRVHAHGDIRLLRIEIAGLVAERHLHRDGGVALAQPGDHRRQHLDT